MVEITDRLQVFAAKPALFHGNLETLAPQNRPHPSTEHKIDIVEPKTPEDLKQLVLTLQTHPENGRPFSNVPFTLYKGSSMVDEGITDDLGRIAIAHESGATEYTVELANGEKFDLKAWEKFDPQDKARHAEQILANRGVRALDGSAEGRTHS